MDKTTYQSIEQIGADLQRAGGDNTVEATVNAVLPITEIGNIQAPSTPQADRPSTPQTGRLSGDQLIQNLDKDTQQLVAQLGASLRLSGVDKNVFSATPDIQTPLPAIENIQVPSTPQGERSGGAGSRGGRA